MTKKQQEAETLLPPPPSTPKETLVSPVAPGPEDTKVRMVTFNNLGQLPFNKTQITSLHYDIHWDGQAEWIMARDKNPEYKGKGKIIPFNRIAWMDLE